MLYVEYAIMIDIMEKVDIVRPFLNRWNSLFQSNRSKHSIIQFCNMLITTLQSIASLLKKSDQGNSSISTRKGHMWERFNEFVTSTRYKEKWLSLLSILGMDGVPIAVIAQHVAHVLLDSMIIKLIPQKKNETINAELSTDEEEAIRYTCGYIVKALKKKLAKQYSMVAVLDAMHPGEDDGNSENFLSYTSNWIARVDRGGLYKVNDETFLLVTWMELTLREYLCDKDINIS